MREPFCQVLVPIRIMCYIGKNKRNPRPNREKTLLTKNEQSVLKTFRQFLITPGQMLCFYGPKLKAYKSALRQLSEKGFIVEEEFKGGYSLTQEGFTAMADCK